MIQQVSFVNSTYGLPTTINTHACDNTPGAPAGSINNFTANLCPPPTGIFFPAGSRCIRLNGKGFVEGMQNDSAYITNNDNTFAVTVNPAGVVDLCRWDGSSWLKLR